MARVAGNPFPKRGYFTQLDDEFINELPSLIENPGLLYNNKSLFNDRFFRQTTYRRLHELYGRGLDHQTHQPLNTRTATDPVAVININNNDRSSNNNNGEFQELEQYISRTQASSLNTESVRQQNSDASSNSISSTSGYSQREIGDPPIGNGGSASVHVASNRVTRDLNAVKKEDADASNSISESTNFSIWEKEESIGSGGYGIVYVARNSYEKHVVFFISDRETRDLCAIKELKDIHKPGDGESIQKEIEILSQLEHTNVVKYYGHEIVGRHISLYMEYIQPGSLKKYILKQGVLPEPLIRNFTAQILSGLVYLHSKRVVHRDIKPDNLLVDSNNIVKLVDFGLAKHLEESVGNHSILGTPYYAAPEVFDKSIEYHSSREAYAADIWSLGCVIIEMFSGVHPWLGFDPVQVIFNVHVKEQHPPIPEKLCQEGNNFLELCFIRTPADRRSASELINHPFVKS